MTWFHDGFFLLSFVAFCSSVSSTLVWARLRHPRCFIGLALTILNLTLAAYWAGAILGWWP